MVRGVPYVPDSFRLRRGERMAGLNGMLDVTPCSVKFLIIGWGAITRGDQYVSDSFRLRWAEMIVAFWGMLERSNRINDLRVERGAHGYTCKLGDRP